MARAKRTDRAEARRRYRATVVDPSEAGELDADSELDPESGESSASPRPTKSRATATPAPVPTARPSVMGAFKAAFRPADLRGDIAALPGLLRHRAFFIPLALIVGAAALIAVTGGTEPISRALSPYFLAPPPVAPVFLAGFLAPRASYLLGGLLGVISSLAVIVILSSSSALQEAATGTAATAGLQTDVILSSFLVSIFGGAFYAAAAAWYKRFLALANPARAARTNAKQGTRSGRRQSNDRPTLARRR